MEKYVLITGVSGGMGYHTALEFINHGYKVIGLDIKDVAHNENLIFYKVDLTKAEEIDNVHKELIKKEIKLDSIINLAGIYDLNSLIEMKEEDFIRIFNINVFSTYRINKEFIDLLIEKGKIFITSSELAPLDPLPFTGIYGITKTSIEKYAYSLRMELQLLGYKVIVIRPGAVDTGLLNVSTDRLEAFLKNTTHYEASADKFRKIVNSVEAKKIPPSKIGELIYKVHLKKKPKYLYSINRNPLLKLMNALPQRLQNFAIRKILEK